MVAIPAARGQHAKAPQRVKRTWNTAAACFRGEDMPRKPLEGCLRPAMHCTMAEGSRFPDGKHLT